MFVVKVNDCFFNDAEIFTIKVVFYATFNCNYVNKNENFMNNLKYYGTKQMESIFWTNAITVLLLLTNNKKEDNS